MSGQKDSIANAGQVESITNSSGKLYYGPGFSWVNYESKRPQYPQHALDAIFAHHAARGNRWKTAADFGTGIGTLVPPLLDRFYRVSASDINQEQIDIARKRFNVVSHDRLDFHVAKAEDPHPWLEEGSVDMCIAGEAVHWFDSLAQNWIAHCARLLRPGGTIAFLFYPATPTIISNSKAAAALNEMLKRTYVLLVAENIVSLVKSGGLEIEFSPALYETESRIHYVLPPPYVDILYECEDSRVQKRTGPLMRHRGWTLHDFEDYWTSLGSGPAAIMNTPDWQQAMRTIENEIGGKHGVLDVAWPLWLGIASRR